MQRSVLVAGLGVVITACAHGGSKQPEITQAAIAAVRADLRIVSGESTWVTQGPGYELVGRSKADLAQFQPALDREAAMFHRVFPIDSLSRVIVAVRRVQSEGKPFVAAAPTPADDNGFVVELVIPNPNPKAPRIPDFVERSPVLPVVRAWLSAHATALTKQQARSMQAKGEVDDPRVPAWAEETIPMLIADSAVDKLTVDLATHQSQMIPLTEFFTMARPAPLAERDTQGRGRSGDQPQGGRGGSGGGGGTPPGGMGGGGMGGTGGGRGGMGGGRGGMGGGRGGMGGSRNRNPGGGDERPAPPMSPQMAFFTQSAVFGKYLSRDSYELIGDLVDAQILGQSVDSVLERRKLPNVARMEPDWREWLSSRAGVLTAK